MKNDDVAEQERTLQCPECPRKFVQHHALGKHRRSAHGVPGQARRRAAEGPKKPCPVCGKQVADRNSQWMAHARTHPAGSRRWTVTELYWEWEYRLEHEQETGPTVKLTRTEATRDVKSRYSVHIDYGKDTLSHALQADRIKDAQIEAEQVFRRYPTPPHPVPAVRRPSGGQQQA